MFASLRGGHFDDLARASLDYDMTTASKGKMAMTRSAKFHQVSQVNVLLTQSGALHWIGQRCAGTHGVEGVFVLFVITHDVSGEEKRGSHVNEFVLAPCLNRLFGRRSHNSVGHLLQSLALYNPLLPILPQDLDFSRDCTTAQALMCLYVQTSARMRKRPILH
jgi:hypothetical protein